MAGENKKGRQVYLDHINQVELLARQPQKIQILMKKMNDNGQLNV